MLFSEDDVRTDCRGRELVNLSLRAKPLCVREALSALIAAMAPLRPSPDDRATVEIVLAEVMNNIVEHACAHRPDGRILLRVVAAERGICCELTDNGAPLPGRTPPPGQAPNLDCQMRDLAEGGFGWLLINGLTHDLRYERRNGHNRLSFGMHLQGTD